MPFPRRSDGSQRCCETIVRGDRRGLWQRLERRLSSIGQCSGVLLLREQFKDIAVAIVNVEPDPFEPVASARSRVFRGRSPRRRKYSACHDWNIGSRSTPPAFPNAKPFLAKQARARTVLGTSEKSLRCFIRGIAV